jgi:signal peptidase I
MAKRSPSDTPSKSEEKSTAASNATAVDPPVKAAIGNEGGKGAKNSKDKPKPHDGGWRETIESLAMAIILALLFKGYVAEAFVIPTGSMAPTLQGRHKDVCCPECGYWYQTTASDEVDQQRNESTGLHVISGTCPICRYTQYYDPKNHPNDGSFSGDRIIVSKFAYEIGEPQRWDVIVFKWPEGATQNYIKRLVGLPGEQLTLIGGNVYARDEKATEDEGYIARKPPNKLTAMLQIVDDSDHIPPTLTKIGWPPRWRAAADANTAWKSNDGGKTFGCETPTSTMAWLRYRHLIPTYADWESITLNNRLPADVMQRRGQLITDLYAYNTSVPLAAAHDGYSPLKGDYEPPRPNYNHAIDVEKLPERLQSSRYGKVRYDPELAGPGIPCDEQYLGNHWVDDLAVECVAEIQDAQGMIALDLVRAGVHYTCTIDLSTGQATLRRTNAAGKDLPFADEEFRQVMEPQAATSVKGAGYYRLRLTNCDHQVLLFVNGKVVQFDKPTFYDSDDVVVPQWTAQDALDLEPAGVGISGARAKVSHLRIYRDKYYIAIGPNTRETTDYSILPTDGNGNRVSLQEIFATPEMWASSRLFDPENRPPASFDIAPDHFFPMGDNSPGSSDGRYWHPTNYVHRDLLIGKALLIYWPHSWNRPPLLPHFQRMGRIR